MKRLAFKLLLCFICFCAYSGYAQEAKIKVITNYKEATRLVLRPTGMIPLYDHATAPLNNKGEGTITFDPQVPLVADLLCENEQGRPMCRVTMYIEPGKSLQVNFQKVENQLNSQISFEGELAAENEVLRSLMTSTEEEVNSALEGKDYTPLFKVHLKEVTHLKSLNNKLNSMQATSKEYTKMLKELVQAAQKGICWQSLPDWARDFDYTFDKGEAAGLLKTGGDFAKRLDCIENETIKCRYGIYKARMLVNSRRWFEKSPIPVLDKLKPYITNPVMKKELESIYAFQERIETAWKHLRTAPAPDFTFEDVNGKMVTLSDFRGKFVLLDVWNIYCGPCRDQVPFLQKLEPELKEMGVEVIGVSCDPQDIKDKWQKAVKDQNMPGIQTIMDNGRKSNFMKDYCISGFPTFILINPDGMVVNPYVCRPEQENQFMTYIQQKIKEYQK